MSDVYTPAPNKDTLSATIVQKVYRTFLNREASASDIAFHLSHSRDAKHFLAVVLDSAEYARCSTESPAVAELKVVNIWHPDLSTWTHPPGMRSTDGAAIVGHEGWIFLCGGSNQFVPQFTGELTMDSHWLESWRSLVDQRRTQIARSKRKAVFLVVPEKVSVLTEHYPEKLPERQLRPVRRLLEEAGLPIVYPLEELRSAAQHHQVCFRTDSHFTVTGNQIIYNALVRELGMEDLRSAVLPPPLPHLGSGDLGRKFLPAIQEIMYSPKTLGSACITQDNWREMLQTGGHIGTRRVFQNDLARDQRTVVVFGDSYAFGDVCNQGLSWFLSQAFREVHFVWIPCGWDPEYVDRVGADVIVMEMAERFVARVPVQQVDVSQLVKEAMSRGKFVEVDAIFTDAAV